MQTNLSSENNDALISNLIGRLDKASEIIDSKVQEENRTEFHAQSIVYAAFLSDYENGVIEKNKDSTEILSLITEFCELVEEFV